ncbi:MAG: hypothetical protein PV362_07975 [Providencia heimbachae]|nr:hypothetical protein [Providencia heimbachae]
MSLELAIKENTEVMRQLIAAMQSGAVVQTHTTLKPNEKPQPTKAENKVVTDKKETAKTEIHAVIEPVGINTLNLEQIVALAVLFKGKFEELTTEHLSKITEIIEGTGKKRNTQADALHMALVGLDELASLDNNTVHDLCLEMLDNWNDIPGITERREYAIELLSEGKTVSEEPEPEEVDPKVLFPQAEQLILQVAKSGGRSEAVGILNKFGAKKLSEVPEDKLAEVIKLAKKVLEG